MRSLPPASKRALQIGGIVTGVMLLGVLIAGVVASLRQPGRVDAVVVDSSTSTVSTSTTAPAEEPEASVGPSAGEVREEATATTPLPEPSQGSSATSAVDSDQPEQTTAKKPSSSGSTSHQTSQSAGKCQPVGCNGGRGDHYTPDIDAPSGHHTAGSGPEEGTAKAVPDQPGVVDLNQ